MCVFVVYYIISHSIHQKKHWKGRTSRGVNLFFRLHFIFKAISQPISSLEHLGRDRKCWLLDPEKPVKWFRTKYSTYWKDSESQFLRAFPGPGTWSNDQTPGDPQELHWLPTMPPTQFSSKSARCTTRPALFGHRERVGLLTPASHHLKNPQQNQLFCSFN